MKLIETKTITTKEWLNMLRIAESRIGIDADQDLEKFLVSLFEKTIHEPDYPNAELTDALYFLSKKKEFSNQEILILADKCLIEMGLYPNKISSHAVTPDIIILSGGR